MVLPICSEPPNAPILETLAIAERGQSRGGTPVAHDDTEADAVRADFFDLLSLGQLRLLLQDRGFW